MSSKVSFIFRLHKAIKGNHGILLVKGVGEGRLAFVRYIMKQLLDIQNQGVKLLVVFDGGKLAEKQGEEEERRKVRESRHQKAIELIDNGDQKWYKELQRAIDITPDLAYYLLKELKNHEIPFIVAPYEADAQLAYLCRQGFVNFIITEDSDMIPFGCPKVLFKYKTFSKTGDLIFLEDIKIYLSKLYETVSHCQFLISCILSGCDYLKGLPGIGIKTAMKNAKTITNVQLFLEERHQANKTIPKDYYENFMKAFLTFRFQNCLLPKEARVRRIKHNGVRISKLSD